MKASHLLRGIIAQKTLTPPEQIILSGVLDVNYRPKVTTGISYQNHTVRGVLKYYGFHSQIGWIDLEECIDIEHKSRGNHDVTHSTGTSLKDYPLTEKMLLFVVIEGDDSDYPHSQTVKVYSSPNWAKQKSLINQEDLTRWEEWYNA